MNGTDSRLVHEHSLHEDLLSQCQDAAVQYPGCESTPDTPHGPMKKRYKNINKGV